MHNSGVLKPEFYGSLHKDNLKQAFSAVAEEKKNEVDLPSAFKGKYPVGYKT